MLLQDGKSTERIYWEQMFTNHIVSNWFCFRLALGMIKIWQAGLPMDEMKKKENERRKNRKEKQNKCVRMLKFAIQFNVKLGLHIRWYLLISKNN